eukprot:TRINITY_DN4976_c0_g1_i10.p1 TRINITY_DN4976_c0_g1~~TRINITY_DN4976_c0_g1_i10.p1  ORF type:complete len:489 (-),score=99.66 TRINITY_DN4976_c0_g1_i10:52-1518(-)
MCIRDSFCSVRDGVAPMPAPRARSCSSAGPTPGSRPSSIAWSDPGRRWFTTRPGLPATGRMACALSTALGSARVRMRVRVRVRFRVTDTAGLQAPAKSASETDKLLGELTESVVASADLCVFTVDGRAGVTVEDERIGAWLRPIRNGRPTIVVATKCENDAGEDTEAEAARMGYGSAIRVSAEHNEGMIDLGRALIPMLSTEPDENLPKPEFTISVVGVPNVGKSTLVNTVTGEQRVLVGEQAGLTRERISTRWQLEGGQHVQLLDTAGLQAHKTIGKDRLSLLSRWDTERAIKMSDVVILVIDANMPLTRRDLAIGHQVVDAGKALVVAANKLDALPGDWSDRASEVETHIRGRLRKELAQLHSPRVVAISAKEGQGLGELLEGVTLTHEAWNKRVSTSHLNDWLQSIQHSASQRWPAGLNLKYISQTSIKPPTFTMFYNMPRTRLPTSQKRRLLAALNDEFRFDSTPIRLIARKNESRAGHGGKHK